MPFSSVHVTCLGTSVSGNDTYVFGSHPNAFSHACINRCPFAMFNVVCSVVAIVLGGCFLAAIGGRRYSTKEEERRML